MTLLESTPEILIFASGIKVGLFVANVTCIFAGVVCASTTTKRMVSVTQVALLRTFFMTGGVLGSGKV